MTKLWQSILPIFQFLNYVHLRWARWDMHPLDPDLPEVIVKINAYEAKGIKL